MVAPLIGWEPAGMTDQGANGAVGNDRGGDDVDDELIAAAALARRRSYVPYSKFEMGAAVRCADGSIVLGALVENVSLGLAMCAERVALFGAVAQAKQPVALALVASRTSGELTQPCGACLQVGLELAGPGLVVTAADPDGDVAASSLDELLVRPPHRHRYAAPS